MLSYCAYFIPKKVPEAAIIEVALHLKTNLEEQKLCAELSVPLPNEMLLSSY